MGELPLNPEVRIGGDTGRPVALREVLDKDIGGFLDLARNTMRRLEEVGPQEGPKIEIMD